MPSSRSSPPANPRTAEDRRDALQAGHRAERWVADSLEEQGWIVVGRNVRVGGGELDLIVSRGGVVRFVEVKARGPGGEGLEAITPSKQRLLRHAAEAWLQACEDEVTEAAFLVALVTMDVQGWSLELLDDAF